MINKDINTRIIVTIPIELKKQLEQLAMKDSRSLSNLIIKILKEYVKNNI